MFFFNSSSSFSLQVNHLLSQVLNPRHNPHPNPLLSLVRRLVLFIDIRIEDDLFTTMLKMHITSYLCSRQNLPHLNQAAYLPHYLRPSHQSPHHLNLLQCPQSPQAVNQVAVLLTVLQFL